MRWVATAPSLTAVVTGQWSSMERETGTDTRERAVAITRGAAQSSHHVVHTARLLVHADKRISQLTKFSE